MTPTEEALRVIGLCERATPGSFTIKYGVNIMAGDDLAATTLSRSSDDATERNMANAAALVEAVNFARTHLPDLLAENERLRRDAERMKRDIAELYELMPTLPLTPETMDAATDWLTRYCIDFYREINTAIDQARGKENGEVGP